MSSLPPNKCGFCEKQSPNLKPCSKCNLTLYCSKQCKRKDWARHKQWCDLLQGSINPQQDPQNVLGSRETHGPSASEASKGGNRKSKKQTTDVCQKRPTDFDSSSIESAPQENRACTWCQKTCNELLKCSKCKAVTYCSQACQKKDWSGGHQKECKPFDIGPKRDSTVSGTPKEEKKVKETESRSRQSEPQPYQNLVCSWCQKVSDTPLKCSRCKNVTYCSPACQKKDWSGGHQKDCNSTIPPKTPKSDTDSVTQDKSKAGNKKDSDTTDAREEDTESVVCEWCQKYLESPLRCSGCKKFAYCSEVCQKKDWEGRHNKECDRSKLKPKNANGPDKKSTSEESASGTETDENNQSSKSCAWCQKYVDSPMKCPGCTIMVYCSSECQKKDWLGEHKKVCEGKKSKENLPPKNASAEGSTGLLGAAAEVEEAAKKDECRACKKGAKDMKRCARCKVVVYCSKSCQRTDWSRHKEECVIVDGVIKTKEFQKAQQEEAALEAARVRQSPPMSPLEMMMAQMMGFLPGATPQRDAPSRMSWTEARRAAQLKHPGCQIVEYFDDLPGEFLWMIPVTQNRVLLAFITGLHPYQTRHAVYIRDVNEEETFVMFYLDNNNPFPFFSWSQVRPGNYICIQNAVFHNFLDGTVGIRVNEAEVVRML